MKISIAVWWPLWRFRSPRRLSGAGAPRLAVLARVSSRAGTACSQRDAGRSLRHPLLRERRPSSPRSRRTEAPSAPELPSRPPRHPARRLRRHCGRPLRDAGDSWSGRMGRLPGVWGAARSRVLDTKACGKRLAVLDGSWSFDAIAPDGSILYLTRHITRRGSSPSIACERIDVRTGLLAALRRPAGGRGRHGRRAGRRAPRRRRSLGVQPSRKRGREPFIHALDTAERAAYCIDLPLELGFNDQWTLKLRLRERSGFIWVRGTHRARDGRDRQAGKFEEARGQAAVAEAAALRDVRDLARDLDDVAVRVVDAELRAALEPGRGSRARPRARARSRARGRAARARPASFAESRDGNAVAPARYRVSTGT